MCVPVKEKVFTTPDSQIQGKNYSSFLAIKTTLIGDYSHLKKAWAKTRNYIATKKFPATHGKVKSTGPDSLFLCKSQPTTTPLPLTNHTEQFVIAPDSFQCIRFSDLMRDKKVGILEL